MEALCRDAGGGAQDPREDAAALGHHRVLLRRGGTGPVNFRGAGHGDGHHRRLGAHPVRVHVHLQRAHHRRPDPALRPGVRAGGQAAHREGERHLGAAEDWRRPRHAGAQHGRRGVSRDGTPPRGKGVSAGAEWDQRVVAGATVRAGGRGPGAHHRRAVQLLLQPGAARDEDSMHGARAPLDNSRGVPELAPADGRAVGDGDRRRAGVDPRRPQRGALGSLLLDDGRTGLPQSDGFCELRHEVQIKEG
ncbi:hypothetical protein VPH35_130937 [Triticum aestivum]